MLTPMAAKTMANSASSSPVSCARLGTLISYIVTAVKVALQPSVHFSLGLQEPSNPVLTCASWLLRQPALPHLCSGQRDVRRLDKQDAVPTRWPNSPDTRGQTHACATAASCLAWSRPVGSMHHKAELGGACACAGVQLHTAHGSPAGQACLRSGQAHQRTGPVTAKPCPPVHCQEQHLSLSPYHGQCCSTLTSPEIQVRLAELTAPRPRMCPAGTWQPAMQRLSSPAPGTRASAACSQLLFQPSCPAQSLQPQLWCCSLCCTPHQQGRVRQKLQHHS